MKKHPMATLLSAAMFLTGAAQAMEVIKFDKMNSADKGDYIQLMADGAEKLLVKEGRTDLAKKVYDLFNITPPGADQPLGLAEFNSNLDQVRIADAVNYAKDHKVKRLEAEQAMLIMLAKNGIKFPHEDMVAFLNVGTDFHPQYPPPDQKKK